MSRPPAFLLIKETGGDGILRKRLECERRDELNCVSRHDDENVTALFHEKARELRGFVSGNRTRHAEDNCFSVSYF